MIFSNYLFPPPFSLRSTCRKRFTPEEDSKLKELCNIPDLVNWEDVAKQMPGRTARQCRDRYNATLKNYIEKKPWTKEEDAIIIEKYKEIGPRWVTISTFLVGRSGNNVKNRWHKHINKGKIYPPYVPPNCEEKSKIKVESKPQDNELPYFEDTQDSFFTYFDSIESHEINCLKQLRINEIDNPYDILLK